MALPKLSPDSVMKYAWVALIIALIAVVVVVVVIPATETKSSCTGFQYFLFLNQKMTEGSYEIELLNGVSDVRVDSVSVDGVNIGAASAEVKAGEKFLLSSANDPTGKRVDETFAARISVLYDIKGGILNNRDSATCTGRVQ
ncbi:MAG: hypothetical protein HY517_00790 [Candidatus Aenigmarchaeota archaeon]|nr:hypothetical protein [Candidatus Aenigmarchaeota archaeon]